MLDSIVLVFADAASEEAFGEKVGTIVFVCIALALVLFALKTLKKMFGKK